MNMGFYEIRQQTLIHSDLQLRSTIARSRSTRVNVCASEVLLPKWMRLSAIRYEKVLTTLCYFHSL